VHALAETPEATDWHRIASLYRRLADASPSPVVELNWAVAVAMAESPEAGLSMLDELEAREELRDYRYLPAARADLLRRAGRLAEARAAYGKALGLAENAAERAFLERRIKEIGN
jgi:RNA polymerase sigma-70 factor (ECF subfamily)